MEVVTAGELAEWFERLMSAVDGLAVQLARTVDSGKTHEYLTREEAAEYLRVSIRKLDSLARCGFVSKPKLGEGRRGVVVFRRTDLDRFVRSRLSEGVGVGSDERSRSLGGR